MHEIKDNIKDLSNKIEHLSDKFNIMQLDFSNRLNALDTKIVLLENIFDKKINGALVKTISVIILTFTGLIANHHFNWF